MESNSRTGRSNTVASAVRKLRARAASISLGRTRVEPTLAGDGQVTEGDPTRLHYPQPHLSLVPEPAPETAETHPTASRRSAAAASSRRWCCCC
jgi:hypothetical protein